MSVALGLVGFGIMGERLLRAALAHDPAVIRPVAVWDPSPTAAARLKEIAPGLPMLGSAAEVTDYFARDDAGFAWVHVADDPAVLALLDPLKVTVRCIPQDGPDEPGGPTGPHY